MSYAHKGVWVNLFAMIATTAAYVIIILRDASGVAVTEIDYAPALFWTIGISVGLNIVVSILVEIVTPSERQSGDVRDRAITVRGGYVCGLVVSFGMIGPLLLAIADAETFWIANTMFAVMATGAIVGNIVQLASYRRGF
ncbi:MAG: hypothetical protein ACOH19_16835 [Rhodoglobus sp.]